MQQPLPTVRELLDSLAAMAHCTQTHCVDDAVATVLPSAGVAETLTPLHVAMAGALMGAALLVYAAGAPPAAAATPNEGKSGCHSK